VVVDLGGVQAIGDGVFDGQGWKWKGLEDRAVGLERTWRSSQRRPLVGQRAGDAGSLVSTNGPVLAGAGS
jgi:hypothetical protein